MTEAREKAPSARVDEGDDVLVVSELLATLFAVTRVLSESGSLTEAAPSLLSAVGLGLGFEAGEFWRAGTDASVLQRVATWRREPDVAAALASSRSVAPGRGLAEGRPRWEGDALVIPISAGDPSAALVFFGRSEGPAGDELLRVAADIASRVAQLHERERTETILRRLVKAVETIELGVTITDFSGTILFTNP
ncbi:MAG TPA: hypothetical protein VGR00_09510, partial [Thermoanaerobaculia bacterium]|nr:hypothetical protein [Thermoanaerobaculia bacterium]